MEIVLLSLGVFDSMVLFDSGSHGLMDTWTLSGYSESYALTFRHPGVARLVNTEDILNGNGLILNGIKKNLLFFFCQFATAISCKRFV